jgi:hypothetical protein
MLNDFFFSDDNDPKKDAATIPPFGFSAAPEVHSQEEAMVVKPLPVSPKNKATAPPSKRQKRGAAAAASLEVHQPSSSSDKVSSAAYTRFFLSLILKFLYNLYPTGRRSFFLLVLSASRFKRLLMPLKVYLLCLRFLLCFYLTFFCHASIG